MQIKALYTGELSVTPVGRVGSYTAAVKARRCRARKYWAIQEFELRPGMPSNAFHERTDLGKFKTKTTANAFLLEAAKENGYTVTYGDLNTYVSISIK